MTTLTTTVTPAQVALRCGLRPGGGLDAAGVTAEAERLTGLALADLEEALEHAFREMPQPVVDECVLTIAKAWSDRVRSSREQAQTTTTEAQRRPVVRDTRAGISTILARYTVGLA